MKKIFTLLLSCLMISYVAFSQDGPVTTAGSVTACIGTPVSVPVTVTGIDNVGAISLTLNFDSAVLEYQGADINIALAAGSLVYGANPSDPGIFRLSYSSSGINLADNDILFTLNFNYIGPCSGGTSLLTWNDDPPEDNEYAPPGLKENPFNKNPFEDYFINGSVTIDAAQLVELTYPADLTVLSCQSQAAVNASYAAWLGTASVSGGANPVLTNNSAGAPPACGGSKTVTWTVASQCAVPITCTATFTVPPAEMPSCQTAGMTAPVVDGKVDASYQFLKNINIGTPGNDVYGRGTLYKFEDANTLYLAYVESRGVNDNVYGPSASDISYAGWNMPHPFDRLLASDKLQLQILNPGVVFDQTLDYLFKQTVGAAVSYNSGLKKFAPAGATIGHYDGSSSGTPGYESVVAAKTSCDFNQSCGNSNYSTDSPGPPEVTGCWEYQMVYEVAIQKSGLGNPPTVTAEMVQVPSIHNSPAKGVTAVSGYKYCDADNNGTRNNGEVGLGGWTINLSGPVSASAITNGYGYYEFFNLPAGTYTLTETAQPGYIQTQSPAAFTLCEKQVARDKDFGNALVNIMLICPMPAVLDACLSQEEVEYAFDAWLATASVTGGCNVMITNDNTGAPSAYGGTTTVHFTATSCNSPVTCESVFTVTAPQSCPPASAGPPVVDGLLDPCYRFFKNVSNSVPSNDLYSRGTLYKFEDESTLWLAYIESRGVNDNVYGPAPSNVAYAGWTDPKQHKFNDLLKGDKAEIQLFNPSSVKVFDVTFDYLFKQTVSGVNSYNSGLIKFMPAGGKDHNYDGSSSTAPGYSNVTAAKTSLDYNQACGFADYDNNSPGPPEISCWEYRMVYEVAISKTGLGLSCPLTDPNMIQVPVVVHSPNKSVTAISGVKYCDANNNEEQDPGEAGLSGVTISLAGATNASATTNVNGYFEFFNVAPGAYTLTEVVQLGFQQTQSPDPFDLASKEVARDKNFGNSPKCLLENSPVIVPLPVDSKEKANLAVEIVPNPFKVATEVRVTSPVQTAVSIEIYNFQGIKISTLFDGMIEANVANAFRFDADDYQPAQIYLCVIRSHQANVVRKIVRIR